MKITGKLTNLVYTIATGDIKTKLLLTPIVASLYLGLIALFVFISFIMDRLLLFPSIVPLLWSLVAGVLLIIMGFILMIFSVIYFVKVKGTPVPFNPPPTLVTTGPYKYMRNPMLTGIFIQLFGLGILCHSISLLFIFTPLFILLNIWELKNIEEPELEKRIGKEYTEYKKRVPMFFPFIKVN